MEKGHEVAIFHRGQTEADLPGGAEEILGDRNALSESLQAFRRFAPDAVLDVIPYTERHALDLVETFRGLAGRLVVLSSCDVYRNFAGVNGNATAPPDPIPLRETAPLRETFYPYRGSELELDCREDYEKILVERTVLTAADLPATVLRLPMVYGPGDKHHRLLPYLIPMVDKRPAIVISKGHAGWHWSRSYSENIAAAIALAVTNPSAAGEIFNVGDTRLQSEKDWMAEIAKVVGWTGKIVTVDDPELPEALRHPYDWNYELATDNQKIREILGFEEAFSLQAGIEQTVEWELEMADEAKRPNYDAEDAFLSRRGGSD